MLSAWRKGASLVECVQYEQKQQWNTKPKMRKAPALFPGLPQLQVLIACNVLQNLEMVRPEIELRLDQTSLQCRLTTKMRTSL